MPPAPIAWIELSSAAVRANLRAIRSLLPNQPQIAGVVKANAYGHGLAEMVQLTNPDLDLFQVDDWAEFAQVRRISPKSILILGGLTASEAEAAIQLNATIGVSDIVSLQLVQAAAIRAHRLAPVHLEIDARLGRLGILEEQLDELLSVLAASSHVRLVGVYTHFANIEDTANLDHAYAQLAILQRVVGRLATAGYPNLLSHIAATSGILTLEPTIPHPLVRLGIGLYGLWPSAALAARASISLTPVARWVARIAQVKRLPAGWPIGYGLTHITRQPTTIAVIPQGYSDGYDRGLSNRGTVLVGGRRCPILGRVMMNMCVADVTQVPTAQTSDEVVLLGSQGTERITADEIAEQLGTINYEVVARLSPLLPRVLTD